MTHTKGPWEVRRNEAFEEYWIRAVHYDAGPARIIAKEEDARLIAAAPDLLEALRDCVERFTAAFPASEEYEPIKKARAAISQATHKPQEG